MCEFCLAGLDLEPDYPTNEEEMTKKNPVEWGITATGGLVPSAGSLSKLTPGVYAMANIQNMFQIVPKPMVHDLTYDLGDTSQAVVMANIGIFLKSRHLYQQYGLLYKRGILMHGVPGGGKTVMLSRIADEIVRMGGIVLKCDDGVHWLKRGIEMIKSVQPNDLLLVILEDIDQYVDDDDDERVMLELLDGNSQADNIVFIATTNKLDEIPDRVKNRPSRFDTVCEILAPTASARRAYLKALDKLMTDEECDKIVGLTDGFVVAQLKEVFLLIRVYGYTIEDAVKRFNNA